MALIQARGLTKEFKVFKRREGVMGAFRDLFRRDYINLRAVDGIDFIVERGEMVGYIGANGAGKSTTIKMLTGILVPTSGSVVVDGYVPYQNRETYTKSIGVVFGQRSQLWWDIAVIEYCGGYTTFQGMILSADLKCSTTFLNYSPCSISRFVNSAWVSA